MSKNIVFQGWLTKSPPTKRVWRTRWHRRWFALRQSGELPGQYFLDYYTDRSCRRLKGTINLDLCEQVDAGLHMERSGTGAPDPSIRGSVFRIQTQSRIYHLEADCQADMEKWVDAICRVCGLRALEETNDASATYQNTTSTAVYQEASCPRRSPGVYIPISECITGVKAQDAEILFTFDTSSIVRSEGRKMYNSQPNIRTNVHDDSDDSPSDEECKSWNCSQNNEGPPVPPRPPKTLSSPTESTVSDLSNVEKVVEKVQIHEAPQDEATEMMPLTKPQRRYANTSSPARLTLPTTSRAEEPEEYSPGATSLHYYNLPSLPPAVDRALKPRPISHSVADEHPAIAVDDESSSAGLVYSVLDLPVYSPSKSTLAASQERRRAIGGKSAFLAERECPYKQVDFLKTEAFNMTRQDAEASRNNQN